MRREKSKRGNREDESTKAGHRGGTARSSDEGPVTGLERRGRVILPWVRANFNSLEEEPMTDGEPMDMSDDRAYAKGDDGSRMSRETHVRFCEGVGVKFPRATRQSRLIHNQQPPVEPVV